MRSVMRNINFVKKKEKKHFSVNYYYEFQSFRGVYTFLNKKLKF